MVSDNPEIVLEQITSWFFFLPVLWLN